MFAYVENYSVLRGDGSMGEEQKEKRKEEPQSKALEEALEALNAEKKRSEEYLARLKYAQADLENISKRCDRQIDEAKKYSNERLVGELLDVVDELELAIKSGRSSNSAETLIRGVEMTLKKLKKVLENEGLSQIECVGKPFDPSKHNAIEKIEKDDAKECTIVDEVRKGYTMKGKVIRPSIVKIIVKPSSKSQTGDEST